ncbi:MAG TPA: ATP-binding protein [Actinomycetota bacterium]|nr:ATP-binding protein [Actinomycetota bacterium]
MGRGSGEPRTRSRTVPAGPTCSSQARWFLWAAVQDVPDLDVDLVEAALLTTEVASNASRHGKEPIDLSVALEDPGLRVSVHDTGPGFDPDDDAVRGAGYGVRLMEALAAEWGVERRDDGTEVWFRM